MVVEILLTQGKVALVDDEDKDLLNAETNWFANRMGSKTSLNWYVTRHSLSINGKRGSVRLHRLILERILGRSLGANEQVDHINHNGLDNRRSNLRLASNQENCHNQRLRNVPKSSKFKGVSWHKHRQKWQANINFNGRKEYLGIFHNEEDAALAYDSAAKELFGRFCCLNFPDES